MNKKSQSITLRISFVAVFAAIICAGCFISIPLPGGVPITLQNAFALLSGTILGTWYGGASVAIFLILGIIGVPVFSGMKGGFAHLLGASGGFLWGYLIGAIIAGFLLGSPKLSEKKITFWQILKIFLAYFLGLVVLYIFGIWWFIQSKGGLSESLTMHQVLMWTLIPFIPGDIIKMVIAIPLTAVLRPVAARYLFASSQNEKSEKDAVDSLKNEETKTEQVESEQVESEKLESEQNQK